jgi:hypothetical protein
VSKSIILSIIARLEAAEHPEASTLVGNPRPALEARTWACIPAMSKTVVVGDRQLIADKKLVSLKAASDEQLLSLVATYDRQFIATSIMDANARFNQLVADNGLSSTSLGAVTDKLTGDGIAWNASGNAIYWKAAPAGFAHAFAVEPVKTLMAEFQLDPGILDGIDAVNLQLLADQTGTSVRGLRSMNLSRDHRVLADLALRVINVVSVFKLAGERQATMAELNAAVEGLRPKPKPVPGSRKNTDEGWVDQDGKAVDPKDMPAARAMAKERRKAMESMDDELRRTGRLTNHPVKAAAITKEFDAKGEQGKLPTDKDHYNELLDDSKRPAVIIDVVPENDPLKVKQSLYTAKEVSVADLQKNVGKYALAEWCVDMETAKKHAKWLELRRADYQPLPDHWVPPAGEAAGEGVQEVKDEANGGKQMTVKEIKVPSSPQAIEKTDKIDDTTEQVQKLRTGQVMAAGPVTVSFVKKDNAKGPDDDEVEATVKPASEEIDNVLEAAGYKKVGDGVYAIYKVDQWAAMDQFKKALAKSDAGSVVEEAEHTLVLDCGAPVTAARSEEQQAFEDGLMDGGELDSEDVDGADVRVYDNGGETFDRYTIVVENPEDPGERSWLGSSENPFHPQGFGQHLGDSVQEGTHLGEKIKFANLPEQVQKFVRQEAEAYAPQPETEVQGGITAAWQQVDEKNGKKLWIDRSRSKKGSGEFEDDDVHPVTVTDGDQKPGRPMSWISWDEFKTPSGKSIAWEGLAGQLMAAPKDPKKKPAKKKAEPKPTPKAETKPSKDAEATVGDAVPKKAGADLGKEMDKALGNEPGSFDKEAAAAGAAEPADFEDQARSELAKELGVDPDDLKDNEVYYPNDEVQAVGFTTGSKEYVVYADEDEADKAAQESVRNDFGPNGEGPDLFNQDFLMGHVDREALTAYMTQVFDEWAEGDADELDDKQKEEWLEKEGLLPDNYLDDPEFDVDTLFQANRETWVEQQVADRLGNDGGQSYWEDNFGDEDFRKIIKDNGFIDVESLVEEAVSADGAGHFLSSYDGATHMLPGNRMVYIRTN